MMMKVIVRASELLRNGLMVSYKGSGVKDACVSSGVVNSRYRGNIPVSIFFPVLESLSES